MGFSSANYKIQKAYQKLQWSRGEKERIIEKLAAARIRPPNDKKFCSFYQVYPTLSSQLVPSSAANMLSVIEYLNSQLVKLESIQQAILKEIRDNKQIVEQAAVEQEEHIRILKAEEDNIQRYKQMQERLEREYQAWRAQQEEARKEREKLLAIIDSALNALFVELTQSDKTYEFLFDGKHVICIYFSDIYKAIENIIRDYFNFAKQEEDYIENRAALIQQIISDGIDRIINQRAPAEHARLLALKKQVVSNETNRLLNSVVQNMQAHSAYSELQEARQSLRDNYEIIYVNRITKEIREIREAASKSEEAASKAQKMDRQRQEIRSKIKIENSRKEAMASSIQVELKESNIQSFLANFENQKREKSSEAQIIRAFSEAQINRTEINTQAQEQHLKEITDTLKNLQTEEIKLSAMKTTSVKTHFSQHTFQKSLFPLLSKNDLTFSEALPPQLKATSTRRRF